MLNGSTTHLAPALPGRSSKLLFESVVPVQYFDGRWDTRLHTLWKLSEIVAWVFTTGGVETLPLYGMKSTGFFLPGANSQEAGQRKFMAQESRGWRLQVLGLGSRCSWMQGT